MIFIVDATYREKGLTYAQAYSKVQVQEVASRISLDHLIQNVTNVLLYNTFISL